MVVWELGQFNDSLKFAYWSHKQPTYLYARGSSKNLVAGYRITAFSFVAELVKSFNSPAFRKS